MSNNKAIFDWGKKVFLTKDYGEGGSIQAHVDVDESPYGDGQSAMYVSSLVKMSDCSRFISLEFDLSDRASKKRIARKRKKANKFLKTVQEWHENYMHALDLLEEFQGKHEK